MNNNIGKASAPLPSFGENRHIFDRASQENDRDIVKITIQELDQNIAREYRLSDHYIPRKWYDFIAKIIVYFKDLIFILGQRGKINDCQRRNRELRSKLKRLGHQINTVSKFRVDRELMPPMEVPNEYKLTNWPDFIAGSVSWEKLNLLTASLSNVQNAISINEKKIAHAEHLISCRRLDSKISSSVQRLSDALDQREHLEACIDLVPSYEVKAAKNRALRKQIEENPIKLAACLAKIKKLEEELIGLLNQYGCADPLMKRAD